MGKCNKDIREMIENRRLRYYEIADKLGVNCFTFSRWLRTELNSEKKKEIIKAIQEIKI